MPLLVPAGVVEDTASESNGGVGFPGFGRGDIPGFCAAESRPSASAALGAKLPAQTAHSALQFSRTYLQMTSKPCYVTI